VSYIEGEILTTRVSGTAGIFMHQTVGRTEEFTLHITPAIGKNKIFLPLFVSEILLVSLNSEKGTKK
jgi:hypothetical protein